MQEYGDKENDDLRDQCAKGGNGDRIAGLAGNFSLTTTGHTELKPSESSHIKIEWSQKMHDSKSNGLMFILHS